MATDLKPPFFFGCLALSNHEGINLMFTHIIAEMRQQRELLGPTKVLFGNSQSFQLSHETLDTTTCRPDEFSPNYMLAVSSVGDEPIGYDLAIRNSFVVSSVVSNDPSLVAHSRRFGELLASVGPKEKETGGNYATLIKPRIFKDEFEGTIPYSAMACVISPRPVFILANNNRDTPIAVWAVVRQGLPFLVWSSDVKVLEATFSTVNNDDCEDSIFYLSVPLAKIHRGYNVINSMFTQTKFSRWRNTFRDHHGTLTAIGSLRKHFKRNFNPL